MYRRRRRAREIPFSFDSFLDVVANVVGIIIRLILVVWVGARSYSSLQNQAQPEAPPAEAQAETTGPDLALTRELEEHRHELAELQARLLDQMRRERHAQDDQAATQRELSQTAARRVQLDQQGQALDQAAADQEQAARAAALSAAELRERSRRLAEELRALEGLPPAKQALRYRTPVSQTVTTDELMFECRKGRVTLIDLGPLLEEVKRGMEDKQELLRRQWQVRATAGPAGAFRLHYTIEREQDLLDAAAPGAPPDARANFRYGVSGGLLEPVSDPRGEDLSAALAPRSQFRQLTDRLDPGHTAVTFWVYPDSFELFRKLRDYLYERDVVVAGRPLPEGTPIGFSRRGTLSRGQ